MVNIIVITIKGKLLIIEIYFTKGSSNKRTSMYDVGIWKNTKKTDC